MDTPLNMKNVEQTQAVVQILYEAMCALVIPTLLTVQREKHIHNSPMRLVLESVMINLEIGAHIYN